MQSDISNALIFDCVYDPYKWVVAYIKVLNWSFKTWDKVYLIHCANTITITEVWHFDPEYKSDPSLNQWQIGYVVTWEKSIRNIEIWDTIIWWVKNIDIQEVKQYIIPWFKKIKPYVYAGIYPIDNNDYQKLKNWLEKLTLNDSSIEYELEDSKALWFGFRCGFLWMLHMDIVKERLFREQKVETIFTIPTVVYLVKSKTLNIDQIKLWVNVQNLIKSGLYKYILNKEIDEKEIINSPEIIEILKPWLVVRSWSDMIDHWMIDEIFEPIANVEIVWPQEYAWNIMALCQDYRWKLEKMDYLDNDRVVWYYTMPMWEILIDFYDKLKSCTKWYATMNYEFKKYQKADLIKLDIFINNEKVEALSWVVHKDKSYYLWREVVEKLKNLIPRHMFTIPIQAWIWTKIIARETIPAMRKDVIAKCYGWDVTRKRKLLAKQKEWKKKMKALGSVNIPSDIFIKMVIRD